MIHDQVDFHNVGDLVPLAGGGLRIQRLPEQLRLGLNAHGVGAALSPINCELRFVCDDSRATVRLAGNGVQARALVFFGDYQEASSRTIAAAGNELVIERPERLDAAPPVKVGVETSCSVIRIMFDRPGVVYHGIDAAGLRPPRPQELPARHLLAYGTSITHGAHAGGPHLTYPAICARFLHADVQNHGLGGGCHCEPELADYLAGLNWNCAVLALSVNMIGAGYAPDAFYERVRYCVDRIAGERPQCPVVCVTIYPHFRDWQPDAKALAPVADYRQQLRRAVAEIKRDNVRLCEGPEILADHTGLSVDLIHPGDYGFIEMGTKLASHLGPRLAAAGL